jgi:DNA-directed RNA polymerase specialized sigma24 family protein
LRRTSARTPSCGEERETFRTWLLTVARNLASDEARRNVFRRTDPIDAPGGAAATEPSDLPSPDRAAAAAQLRPKLEAALAALPAEQREDFDLGSATARTGQRSLAALSRWLISTPSVARNPRV